MKKHLMLDPARPWCEWLEGYEKAWKKTRDDRYPNAVEVLVSDGSRLGFPVISAKPEIQAWYVAQRLDGNSHKLAEMFATGITPGIMTDSVFLEGHCNGNQFDGYEGVGDEYKRMAEAAGVNTKGMVYVPGLASFSGDPTAWVNSRGDVQRVCELKGMTSTGAVNYKSAARDPAPDVDVADDIVDQAVAKRVGEDPSLAFKDQGELRHEVKESIKPHWG